MSTLHAHRHVWRAAAEGSATTLLLLHGTGGDEHSLLPLAVALDPGAAVLAVRGSVLEGAVPRFFRRIPGGDNPNYPFTLDLEDLRVRTEVLADFVASAASAYGFDPAGVVAVGFSNGANAAAGLLLHRPDALRAAILASPNCPWDGKRGAPDALAHLAVLLLGGRHDPIGLPEQVERLAGAFADRGAAVELRWHDGGHELPPAAVSVAGAWLTKWQAATAAAPWGVG